jgi:hypothetical protein
MASANFRYSDLDIYCTEINVLIAPTFVS